MTVTPEALAIGKRIADQRERIGITQEELAAKVASSRGAIGQYETGKATPRFPRLEKIALALQVSTGWLLHGDDPEQRGKAHTKTELDVLEVIRRMPARLQATGLRQLQQLADLADEDEKKS